MDRLQSPERYREVVAEAKRANCRLSNCYFLPPTVRRLTEAGTLYCQIMERGLLLLDDNGGFYRCYYFLPPDGDPAPIALDKPAVMEFPFNGALSQGQRLQIQKIEALGFRLGRESGLMSAQAAQVALGDAECGADCPVARPEDAPQILALVNGCFNPLYAFLPSPAELDAALREGRVLALWEGERLVAALISGFEKSAASIQQVAVAEGCRGRGLGRAIVQAYHRLYAQRAASFSHWVDLNNAPAVGLYLSLGYSFGLRRANEYVLL